MRRDAFALSHPDIEDDNACSHRAEIRKSVTFETAGELKGGEAIDEEEEEEDYDDADDESDRGISGSQTATIHFVHSNDCDFKKQVSECYQ